MGRLSVVGHFETQKPHMNEIDDTQRLTYLENLIKFAPHAQIFHNDDPEDEDDYGPVPVGFTIRVHGCELSTVSAATFRDCIDKEILCAQREEWTNS